MWKRPKGGKVPGLARFVASEALAYAMNAAMLPFGDRRRDEARSDDARVVLFVHGHGGGPRPFAALERSLGDAGFAHAVGWSYRSQGSVAGIAADLAAFARERLAGRRVLVVGHSLGGILARWWIQELDGRERVDGLVTLSTPHRGIQPLPGARLVPVVRDMLPSSPVLRRLHETEARLDGLPCLSIVSTRDHFVRPWEHARFGSARLVPVAHAGHVGVLFSPDVHEMVAEHFRACAKADRANADCAKTD